MTYLLAGTVLLASIILVACTIIKVEVSSDEEGTTTIQPGGIHVQPENGTLGEHAVTVQPRRDR